MIALLLSLVSGLPAFGRWLWPLVAGAFRAVMTFISEPRNLIIAGLAVATAYGYGYHGGRVRERGIWEAKIAAERSAQTQITNAHEALAVKDLEELRQELEERNAKILELNAAADADPNAGRVCLGTDSLRRINRGRKSRP